MWLYWLWDNWSYIHFGIKGSGPYYGFWSGIGSDFGEYVLVVAFLTGLYHLIRHSNCKVTRCWRIGLHKTAAGHRVCRKHHPDDELTHADVLEAHRNAFELTRLDRADCGCVHGTPPVREA